MNDSFGGRLVDLVLHPGRLMDNVGAAPRWPAAGLLLFLAMIGFAWLTSPISGPEQMEVMRDSKFMRMVPEEQWQQQYEQSMHPKPVSRAVAAVGAGFSTWIMALVFGLILGFFARMGGGQGTMKQAIGIVTWSALIPFTLASLVKLPLILATESIFRVTFSLASVVPGLEPGDKLFTVLSSFTDFFTIWGLVVLVIGFRRVFRMSQGAATTAVVLPWLLLTGAMTAVGLLFM
ncbi:MAG TPA: YIP1 family protein [Candidatus Krumholzibacteria bacterium]|nr:YIP1 family protein [Candidatus Krumholzibacteria bacterium]